MRLGIASIALMTVAIFSSCGKKESAETARPAAEAAAPAQPAAGGPHAFVHLKDGSKVPGTIVASSQTDMVVAGDDGIERKIPLTQIKSVEYAEAQAPAPARQASAKPAPPREQTPVATQPAAPARPAETGQPAQAAASTPPAVTTRTYELPAGSDISVRTNEAIDSSTANEGQSFDAQVTRDAKDANGDVVIPRASRARIVIKSASQGGRIRGASDLVLDLQTVVINGREYRVEAANVTQKGNSGVGANKRTATFTGGGAALGAVIGAIAGGGKGAAIGAGAGAGAGALTQILTKGGAIKVPAESVLTFTLDKSLKVTSAQ